MIQKKKKVETSDESRNLTEPSSETSLSNEEDKKGCTNDEVLAVLAHELGHWKGNHVLKQMILSQVNLFYSYLIIFSSLKSYIVFVILADQFIFFVHGV